MRTGIILQKLSLRQALNKYAAKTQDQYMVQAVSGALGSFADFYDLAIETYIVHKQASHTRDESGSPILDSIFGFVKWLYESGMLELLLKLFMGMALAGVSTMAEYVAETENDPFLVTLRKLATDEFVGQLS